MGYTLYGPGLRDPIVLEHLFQGRPIVPTRGADAVRRVGDREGRPQSENRDATNPYKETALAATSSARQPAINAHQIMSAPVITVAERMSILDVWAVFRERRFRHLPVMGADGALVGIISDRDMLRYAATHGRVPPFDIESPEASAPIAGLYKKQVLTATPDTEIRQIARILLEQRIGAMPIVDDMGVLSGMITRSDILRTLVHHIPLELWV